MHFLPSCRGDFRTSHFSDDSLAAQASPRPQQKFSTCNCPETCHWTGFLWRLHGAWWLRRYPNHPLTAWFSIFSLQWLQSQLRDRQAHNKRKCPWIPVRDPTSFYLLFCICLHIVYDMFGCVLQEWWNTKQNRRFALGKPSGIRIIWQNLQICSSLLHCHIVCSCLRGYIYALQKWSWSKSGQIQEHANQESKSDPSAKSH